MEIITSRSKLLSLLTQACELEHGLACSYLYTAFTLKQDLSEGGITWEQLQKIRYWAGQIYFVAAQEMLHLAQAWNLLSAIGGIPYYLRPNFPQRSDYYPLNLPLETSCFSLQTIDRFIAFEKPQDITEANTTNGLSVFENTPSYHSVGELYRLIRSGFENIDEKNLFIGEPLNQVGPELVDFPNIIKVKNLKDAIDAINLIVSQGEGNPENKIDCHYGIFRGIRASYIEELTKAELNHQPFVPNRPSISNPIAFPNPALAAINALPITDLFTQEVSDLFDSIYGLMLKMLQYVFDGSTNGPLVSIFAKNASHLMTIVVKPLGEALTLLPAGNEYPGATAGPSFNLSRHISFPIEPQVALIIAKERMKELQARLATLASDKRAVTQLKNAAKNFNSVNLNIEI